ncbi:MAG: hypothetical protein AAB541_02490 [Patescibacteria group bacterium]
MPKANQEQKLLNRWESRVLFTLIFAGLTYGFASLAIDSGSLIEYALTIFFFVWAIKNAVSAIRNR